MDCEKPGDASNTEKPGAGIRLQKAWIHPKIPLTPPTPPSFLPNKPNGNMMRPKDMLLHDETLFRDEEVFTPAYVPEDLTHRDEQIRELTMSLKPGLRGMNPLNTLLYGPPGTGKTTAVKHIFNEINNVSSKIVTVYVNCDDSNTRFGVFSKIHEKIYGHSPPDTGKPLNSIKEKVFRKLSKDGKVLAVALDEMDQMFLNKNIEKLLLDLLKAHTTYGFDRIGIIGIMPDDNILRGLDSKCQSIFNPSKTYFPPYSRSEILDILEKRIRYGLYDGVISPEIADYIVEKTALNGDLRVGIDLIRKSALMAERDSSRKITLEHVQKAYEGDSKNACHSKALNSLDSLERALLNIITVNDGEKSGVIYEKLRMEQGTSPKKYNQMTKKLEHIGLIESAPAPGRGQTRIISLKHKPM
jgi:archaeal cell division control protein 6